MREKKIRTVQQLADALDCNPTEDSLSRRVYKGTDCGAWLSLSSVTTTKVEKQVWTAQFKPSILGPMLIWLRRGRGPELDPRTVKVERQVLDYFLLPAPDASGRQSAIPVNYYSNKPYTVAKFRKLLSGSVPGEHGCISYNPRTLRVKTRVDVERVTATHRCVHIGSIVEGVDQTTEVQELVFPFTMEQFWEAVKNVEDEAKQIWNDTHGCEKCAEHWKAEGVETDGCGNTIDEGCDGITPVWDECPECHGDGAII